MNDPNATDARLELGLLCSQTRDVAEAVTQYQAALRKDPHQVDALYNLGLIAANGGDLDEARQYWTAAAQYGANRESGRLAACQTRENGRGSERFPTGRSVDRRQPGIVRRR